MKKFPIVHCGAVFKIAKALNLWQTIERQSGRLYRGQSVGKLAEDLFLMWRIRVLSLRDEAYMFSLSPNEKNGIGAVSVYLKIVCFLCVCVCVCSLLFLSCLFLRNFASLTQNLTVCRFVLVSGY